MGKSKKSLLFLILLCSVLGLAIYTGMHISQPTEPVTIGFFLGDVEETF